MESSSGEEVSADGGTGGWFADVRVQLFLASFLALFTELAFIRFAPAYYPVVSYFTNVILLVVFLGLGLGVGTAFVQDFLGNSLRT